MEQDKKTYASFVIDDTKYKTLYTKKFENRKPYEPFNSNIVKAFLPGKILKITVNEGETVQLGSDLCVLEAMKMENRIKSPVSGIIDKVHVNKGDVVPKNKVLVEIIPE